MSTHSLICLRNVSLGVSETLELSSANKSNNLGGFLASFYLKRRTREKNILNNVSCDLKSGDRIAVLGPNGAGKTTLLKVMAGIRSPSMGSYKAEVDNIIVLGNHKLGFSSEATVRENIVINGLLKGLTYSQIKEREEQILEFSEMTEYANALTHGLSAGQKARIALAVSLYTEADVYLIDEWIGALDDYFFKKFSVALGEKVSMSKALMLASHNRRLTRRLCNKAIVLDEGEIVFEGGVSDGLQVVDQMIEERETLA